MRHPRPIVSLLAIALLCGAAVLAGQDTSFRPLWVWSGALTPTSVVIKAKVLGVPKDLHVLYDADRRLQAPQRHPVDGPARPDSSGVVGFPLEKLVPNTSYFYAVTDGQTRTATGEFRTPAEGAMSFEFAAASCAGGNMFSNVSNSTIFTTIENRRPLFFIHMGDFHYTNIGRNDVELFRRTYDLVLTQRRQASLYRHAPIVYMWDDHDYGPNDSNRLSPARPAARAAYAQIVPHYPLTTDGETVTTIQQQFVIGRVHFIVSDLRSERDPVDQPDGPRKSLLGASQRAWLDEAFTRASKEGWPLVIWVSSVPWITRTGDREDGWQPYAWERQWLADRIEALGLTHRMLMIAGDAHMVAIDDGTNSNYTSTAKPGSPGFPVFHAAPLDRSPTIKGGPYTHGVSAQNGQFGWVHVEDDGDRLRVTVTGHRGSGTQIEGMQLQMTCQGGTCAVDRDRRPASPRDGRID